MIYHSQRDTSVATNCYTIITISVCSELNSAIDIKDDIVSPNMT